MDKGTGVGWRSALMVPTRFVIRSSVKRHRGGSGGGQTTGKEKTGRRGKEDGEKTDIQADRWNKARVERGRKRIQKGEIRGQLRGNQRA